MAASVVVAPRRLYADVVQRIVTRIVAGEFSPGTTLGTEAEMCEQFGVSRTVVREALRILGQKGLVDVKHGSGTRVCPPERWDALDPLLIAAQLEHGENVTVLHDLLEARVILESHCVALAATRARPADLARMCDALDTMEASMENPARYAAADALFHRTLMEASRNMVLLRMAEPMRELLEFTVAMTDSNDGALKRALREHVTIFRAVVRRDPDAARAAMLDHLTKTERDLTRLLHAKSKAEKPRRPARA